MVNGSDSSHGVSRVVHHKDFYLRGGDMTVLVENHLYRIHSYFFERESLFFRQKFNAAAHSGDDSERGSTDSNHYTLEDIKSEDFARFLWVFYNSKYSVYDAPLETWLSILRLANRWTFDSVKELAVRELEKIEIEPVEKISIYHENTISRLYLIPSYIAVCKRDKHLSFSEGMKLGMETVLRVAEARERLRLQVAESGIRTPTFEDFEDGEVEVLIREIFSLGSRPTSPHPVTSPHNGTNGVVNSTIKLDPAPPPKVNGASAPRANGGSATDPRTSSVDSLPSIASVMTQAPAPAPAPVTTPTPTTALTATATHPRFQKSPTPTPPATTPLAAEAVVRSLPPPSSDKPKAPQDPSSVPSLLSPIGVGEPSSSQLDSKAGSPDVSITKPVVPSSEHSNDVIAESKDNVNDAEKNEWAKDNENVSVPSDSEGGKKQGQKNKRGKKLKP